MILVDRIAMTKTQRQALCIMPLRRGFTFLEFTVAMVVLGVALSGLFPLLAILSRDLQPLPGGQTSSSPARDGNGTAADLAYQQHTWYLTPYDDPWVRKLGASARVASPSVASATPIPLEPAVLVQDDDDGAIDADHDGLEDYSGDPDTGWIYDSGAASAYGGDQHRKLALPAGSTSTGGAVWQLKITTAGWYSIQATWAAAADQVTDAQYTIYKNDVLLQPGPLPVNQQSAPAGMTSSGGAWASLTSAMVHLAQGDVIKVCLSDVRATSAEGDQYVVADAVRIVQNEVKIESVERSYTRTNGDGSTTTDVTDVTAKVTVTVNLPQQ